MYSIESTVGDYTVVLHDDTVSNSTVKAIDPVLSLEDNTAGTLEFKLAPNNVAYNYHTLYDTQIAGLINLGTDDLINDIESGDIDSSGAPIQNGSSVRTSSFHEIRELEDPENPGVYLRPNTMSLTINPGKANVDLLSEEHGPIKNADMSQQTGQEADDDYHILSAIQELSYVNTVNFRVDADVKNEVTETKSSWQQGQPVDTYGTSTDSAGPKISDSPYYMSFKEGKVTQSRTIKRKFKLVFDEAEDPDIDIENLGVELQIWTSVSQSTSYGKQVSTTYDWHFGTAISCVRFNSNHEAEISASVTYGTYLVWVIRNFSSKTKYDFYKYWFSSITMENTSSVKWCWYAFDANQTFLSGYGNNATYMDLGTEATIVSKPEQRYVRIVLRKDDGSKLSVSDVKSFSFSTNYNMVWSMRYYDEYKDFLRSSSTVATSGVLSVPDDATYYKIVSRYGNSDAIPMSDMDPSTGAVATMYQQYTRKTTTPRVVDMVGRLTSTIRVYRDTFHTNLKELGEANLEGYFEQGRVSANGEFLSHDRTVRLPLTTYPTKETTGYSGAVNAMSMAAYSEYTPGTQVYIKDKLQQGYPDSDGTTIFNDAYRVVYGPEDQTESGIFTKTFDVVTNASKITARNCAVYAIIFDKDDEAAGGWVQSITTNEARFTISDSESSYTYSATASLTLNVKAGQRIYYILAPSVDVDEFEVPLDGIYNCTLKTDKGSSKALEWGLVTFDEDGNVLNSYRWVSNNSLLEIDYTNVTDYSVMLRYVDNSEISPDIIGSAKMTHYNRSSSRTKDEIWEGRVLTEDDDFYGNRTIKCEGALSYLNDTCQPMKIYDDITVPNFFKKLLSYHNSKVDDSKKIYAGNIWSADSGASKRRTTQYQKTLECINDLVEEYGGHLVLRKSGGRKYLDWIEDYTNVNDQVVQFGSNLLDFSVGYNMSEMCTVLLPTGHVTQEGGSSSAGDELPLNGGAGPTYGQLLYQDTTTKEVLIRADASLGGYKTAVAVVEPGKNYYFSGRLHGGLVAYVIKGNADGSGDYYDGGTQIAGREGELGFVDYIDQKITIPAGAHSVVMCSFGNDIQLALKNETEAVEDLDEYLTIENVATDQDSSGTWHQKGSIYISNPETISTYGWIEKQLALDDIEDEQVLYDTAKAYLQNGQFDEMVLELTAIDMNALGVDAESINLLDMIRVVSTPHGIDRYFPVTKLEIPLGKPAEQKFTLGQETEQTLTDVNNSINDELLKKIQATPSSQAILKEAKSTAAALINTATNGYIIMVMGDDGTPRELVISDRPDYTSSQAKVWRWNMGGLGYSDHGYIFNDGNLKTAMTAEGQIVADMITTGTLSAIDINGCRIRVQDDGSHNSRILIEPNTGNNSNAQQFVLLENGEVKLGRRTGSEFPKDYTTYGTLRQTNVGIDNQSVYGILLYANNLLGIETPTMYVAENGVPNICFNGTFKDADGNEHKVLNGFIVT